ncbi:hypothetical protein LEP1GSC071_0700 [Leptospira santarosai str. JET]|nr:hypothetical protein LEP1GSC071_0700 [Leptospira santarosai str. JET]
MKYTYIQKNSRSIWEHEGRFGYLRIHQELRAEGIFVFKNRIYKGKFNTIQEAQFFLFD